MPTQKQLDYINSVKEKVAQNYGFPDEIFGTRWNFAMSTTHRTKRQIQMYEDVITEIVINNKLH